MLLLRLAVLLLLTLLVSDHEAPQALDQRGSHREVKSRGSTRGPGLAQAVFSCCLSAASQSEFWGPEGEARARVWFKDVVFQQKVWD